jgi:hypothetical protein
MLWLVRRKKPSSIRLAKPHSNETKIIGVSLLYLRRKKSYLSSPSIPNRIGKSRKNARLVPQTVQRHIDYRVISFEVSELDQEVRSQAQAIIEQEEAKVSQDKRPYWLTLAEKDAIIWEYKQFDTSRGRFLDPARNPRWKSKRRIDVETYKRWVPMLKISIKRVHARRYLQQDSSLPEPPHPG